MIVILSFEADPHVPLVARHLERRSVPWVLLPIDQAGAGVSAELLIRVGDSRANLRAGATSVAVADIRSIWNRRWMRPRAEDYRKDDEVHQYVAEQWWHTLDGSLRMADAYWINTPASLDLARSKPRQLWDASTHGFSVPPTLVSADLEEVRRFAGVLNLDHLVTKVVSPGTPIVPDGTAQYMIFTQLVAIDDLDEAAVAAAPAIYQPLVEKAYEVRATVVGDEVLACQIESMASPRTAIDWRRYDFERVGHQSIAAPDDICERLLLLCRMYGLVFAAADFVVTPDGEWVFLELNPNGQWGWIEEHTGLPIGERIAYQLAHPP